MRTLILSIIGIALIGGGVWYYFDTKTDTPTWATYINDDLGLKFDYRLQPEKYILIEMNESALNNPNLVEYLTMFIEREYMEAVTSAVPREGPPGMIVMVFNNPNNLGPKAWADANTSVSNTNLIIGEAEEITFSGVPAIRYRADGLYVSDNIVANNNGRIYFISGQYLDESSRIRSDFLTFLRRVSLY